MTIRVPRCSTYRGTPGQVYGDFPDQLILGCPCSIYTSRIETARDMLATQSLSVGVPAVHISGVRDALCSADGHGYVRAVASYRTGFGSLPKSSRFTGLGTDGAEEAVIVTDNNWNRKLHVSFWYNADSFVSLTGIAEWFFSYSNRVTHFEPSDVVAYIDTLPGRSGLTWKLSDDPKHARGIRRMLESHLSSLCSVAAKKCTLVRRGRWAYAFERI